MKKKWLEDDKEIKITICDLASLQELDQHKQD